VNRLHQQLRHTLTVQAKKKTSQVAVQLIDYKLLQDYSLDHLQRVLGTAYLINRRQSLQMSLGSGMYLLFIVYRIFTRETVAIC
jgi:hypothetical protein